MKAGKILIVDDEKDIRSLMQEIFEEEGYQIETAANGVQAKKAWKSNVPDVIFLDVWMPDIDGITLLKEMQSDPLLEQTSIVMMSGHGTIETAIEATKLGAYDFLEKPLSLAKLIVIAERALQHTRLHQENRQLKQTLPEQILPIGKSKLMSSLRESVERLAKYSMPILITGEAGSGKKHFAKAVHKTSDRKEAGLLTFYANDFNALVENALHADTTLLNQLRQIDGGTLVISDADQLNEASQSLLSNLILNHCFQIATQPECIQLDLRVIALSKIGLETVHLQGQFRDDLYQRLQVMSIQVPALRQHTEDIPDLIEHFINQFVTHEGLGYRHFSVSAQNIMRQYSWPGNLRELQNLIQKLLILGNGDVTDEEIRSALTQSEQNETAGLGVDTSVNLKQAKDQFEKAYLSQLLRETGGNVSETAKRSGVDRTNLYRKLKALGIDPKNPL
ncbi:sigma-54 dependent transcriptional regulator [Thiomicrorhabdus sp. zzn3]|uniref:sigma-54-dependent transcriptional regulator n=1 Tax=Thiomicrorhabdus sp. zzn3 TaxID=3039775 RepID=UPI0024363677|nr:sigma-54 dependent transcriptional regulator [Thiomicrorhabdus sp. zzn3]MDG6778939.1 sigma-54 dependent transcriptional regulator [Thiomicrorhabdus sp. zzn3]